MANIFINLNQSTVGIIGWTASIGVAHIPPGGRNAVAFGESEFYNTKAQAWETINTRASQLDYVNDQVQFNYRAVTSYEDVLALVAAL